MPPSDGRARATEADLAKLDAIVADLDEGSRIMTDEIRGRQPRISSRHRRQQRL
jgi:hypothetical protein